MYTWAQQRELVRTNPADPHQDNLPGDPRTRALSFVPVVFFLALYHQPRARFSRDVTRMLMVTGAAAPTRSAV